MSILIVRHGETRDNAEGRVQIPSSPLSENGHRQASALAQRLASFGVTRILSSDYLRARETSSYIEDLTNVSVECLPQLRERNLGDLRGKLHRDIKQNLTDSAFFPTNGESWSQFHKRVADAWQLITQVAQNTQGNVLVVTHGLVCLSLQEKHLAIPEGMANDTSAENTALTQVDCHTPWVVQRLNCIAHLIT